MVLSHTLNTLVDSYKRQPWRGNLNVSIRKKLIAAFLLKEIKAGNITHEEASEFLLFYDAVLEPNEKNFGSQPKQHLEIVHRTKKFY